MKHNAILLHHDFKNMFDMLTYEETGRLICAAFDYDINGIETHFGDKALDLCFARIKDLLDRNNNKYEEVCQKRVEAARKRWAQAKLQNEESSCSMH